LDIKINLKGRALRCGVIWRCRRFTFLYSKTVDWAGYHSK